MAARGCGDIATFRAYKVSASQVVAEGECKTGMILRGYGTKDAPGIWMPTNGDKSKAFREEFLVSPGTNIKTTVFSVVSCRSLMWRSAMEATKPSSLDRFSDDLTPMDRQGRPNCLPILLEELDVIGEPLSVKKKAVAEWLKENEPLLPLLDELEDEGYIDS
ncbi:hypothetical protein GP475_08665 [Corynebacterium poyangense]|uniref:Uncharacterized protein n=1 Tax=Corynebacterium poyangense TaxID=2684405 RepID=A0A7H0SQ75_9CORY|nr:hypothetical protein [Corynebacterium poyangense]MBZ8178360.1 hypothetical protein [Corynebacterium poyangense]QNQ90700.1 hypothetical protein GP475_08665 [Corynebacterium poyangense]